MNLHKNYYTSNKFKNPSISLGFFSRNGGFSKNNYSSLNCSFSSGDNKKNVYKNINYALNKINPKNKFLKIIDQIHSNKVILIKKNNRKFNFKADGLITQDKDISIAILTADCCPIFIFDKKSSFICCLHSGWKGTYLNIVKNAITKIKKLQPDLNSLQAIIGPCLGQKNFEVDRDFKQKFLKKNNTYKIFFKKKINNQKYLFNMRKLIEFQLKENKIQNIENINIDTYSNKKLFFSHRRSVHLNDINTGRMINIISFKH